MQGSSSSPILPRACALCGSTQRTDYGAGGPLQTCARCKRVFYCCLKHHCDHWIVHRASCPCYPDPVTEEGGGGVALAAELKRAQAEAESHQAEADATLALCAVELQQVDNALFAARRQLAENEAYIAQLDLTS